MEYELKMALVAEVGMLKLLTVGCFPSMIRCQEQLMSRFSSQIMDITGDKAQVRWRWWWFEFKNGCSLVLTRGLEGIYGSQHITHKYKNKNVYQALYLAKMKRSTGLCRRQELERHWALGWLR